MTIPFFGPEAWGPLARALEAYVRGEVDATLTVHTDEGEADPMPVALFFRSSQELREVDRVALDRSRGSVLDVGAGAGSMALALQEAGKTVTAVEAVPEAAAIMRERGVRRVRVGQLQELSFRERFDTILLLMNGAALAGTLEGLPALLKELERRLAPGGQVLVDSTDVLAGAREGDAPSLHSGEDYPGDLQFQLEFHGEKGSPFPQLFVDPATLTEVAGPLGWEVETVWTGEAGEYLARLTRQERAESGDS